jgi:small subunit ribosomal protein S21
MIIIKRNEKESIDRMLKKYRQKLKKTKQIKSIRDRKQYTKPSEVKRLQKQKAVYIQQCRDEELKNS